MTKCKWHLCNNEVPSNRRKYCSIQCKNKSAVSVFRTVQKEKALEYKGGCCEICGYNRCKSALHFHHLDPKEKDFSLGKTGETYVWEDVKRELDKCVCLCANCHAEVHAGLHERYIVV